MRKCNRVIVAFLFFIGCFVTTKKTYYNDRPGQYYLVEAISRTDDPKGVNSAEEISGYPERTGWQG